MENSGNDSEDQDNVSEANVHQISPQDAQDRDILEHPLDAAEVANRLPELIDRNVEAESLIGIAPVVLIERMSPQSCDSESKRRKRSHSDDATKVDDKQQDKISSESSDDGTICSICLDHWELMGDHRLCCLKCGHLFGHSCIRRWLQSCPASARVCPSCKSSAAMKDIRLLFAKRICALDKSEEYRLTELLNNERANNLKINQTIAMLRMELAMKNKRLNEVEYKLEQLQKHQYIESNTNKLSQPAIQRFKLAKDKTFDMSKDSGCRVLLAARKTSMLAISQKSSQSLFPGFGIRMFDLRSFRSTHYLHMSSKPVRDLCYSINEDLIASATLEKCVKLFNVQDRIVVSTFIPSDKPIWACALDTETKNFLYLGCGNGSTYIYDIRNPEVIVEEFKVEDDLSPVISIVPIPTSTLFPLGGFVVCKLQSVWCYEYMPTQRVTPTRFHLDGPFVSMCYDAAMNNLLIGTRPSSKYSFTRYVLSKLCKIGDIPALDTVIVYEGSRVAPVMSRSAQIVIKNTTLVAGYLQDKKMVSLWNVPDKTRSQRLPIEDVVYDICPIYDGEVTLAAALSEDKCRIYRIISDS